jgi:Type II secretory pathway, component PulF
VSKYRYRAARPDGEVLDGVIEAASEEAAVRQLQREGLLPIRTRPAGPALAGLFVRRPRSMDDGKALHLVHALATLLEAGLTLDHALRLLAGLDDDPASARAVSTLREGIRKGEALSSAMAARPDLFTPLQVNLVRAGEAAGDLPQALARLADHLERTQALRESVRSALVYPALLLFVAALSVVGLLLFVVPGFSQMFEEMGQALPLATRLVVAAGNALRECWWLLLLLPALIALWFERRLARPGVRLRWHARLLRWPLLGDLLSRLETARFSRTLAMLLESGVPLPRALQLATEVVNNGAIRAALEQAGEALKQGRGLGGPLAEAQLLPPLALQMIRVGEESGDLAPMLHKVADTFDRQTRNAIARLLALLEPALIIGLGLVVAGIIVSILVAVLDANRLLL